MDMVKKMYHATIKEWKSLYFSKHFIVFKQKDLFSKYFLHKTTFIAMNERSTEIDIDKKNFNFHR